MTPWRSSRQRSWGSTESFRPRHRSSSSTLKRWRMSMCTCLTDRYSRTWHWPWTSSSRKGGLSRRTSSRWWHGWIPATHRLHRVPQEPTERVNRTLHLWGSFCLYRVIPVWLLRRYPGSPRFARDDKKSMVFHSCNTISLLFIRLEAIWWIRAKRGNPTQKSSI